jgi:hypothetical protein
MPSEAFSAGTIAILDGALEDAWQRVVASGAGCNVDADSVRMVLARTIFALAKQGELDHRRLVEEALVRFRL